MTKLRFLGLLLLFCVHSHLSAKDSAELWLLSTVRNAPRGECMTQWISASARWDKDMTRLYYSYLEAGVKCDLTPCWAIATIYRHALCSEEISTGKHWQAEAVPIFDMIRTQNFVIGQLSNRSRFQYKSLRDEWFYRNRLKLEWSSACFRPFVSEETFFLRGKEWQQNRVMVGLDMDINLKGTATFAYMLRHRKYEGTWTSQDVAIISVVMRF